MRASGILHSDTSRRRFLVLAGFTSVAASAKPIPVSAEEGDGGEMEVPAVEDLMREHGILRRALLVYSEAASRLSHGNASIPSDALRRTAVLFRQFGEEYHERRLEEEHVFPPLLKTGGRNAVLAKTLTAQHQRGREITDYVDAVTGKGRIGSTHVAPLGDALASFVRMYAHHAAIEDTVIFPAWKEAIPGSEYRELTEEFEELEHRLFGQDGFDDAVQRIAASEEAFGLSNLAALTAPPPPRL